MYVCAGYASYRRWKNMLYENEGGALSDEQQDELIKNNVNGFVGWLLLHIGGIGTKGRRQRFYITYLLQYFGLSRDGIDVNHSMGYGVSLDMFDKMRDDCVTKSTELSRYIKKNNIKNFKDHFAKSLYYFFCLTTYI